MVVRRIGVWSAARLYGGISGIMGLLIGAVVAAVALFGAASGVGPALAGESPSASPIAALFGVGAIVFLPIMYGVIGLIGGALGAALYNLFAGMFGGLELEIQQ